MEKGKYFLKEILCETELEIFLRLRHQVFNQSSAKMLVAKGNGQIDINYYDRNSLHYGVYKNQEGNPTPVGYFRIVLENPTISDHWITNISTRNNVYEMVEPKPASTFPCLGYYPYEDLENRFQQKRKAFERVGEVSRFFIIHTERSMRLSMHIIKSSFAIALLHIQHAFVGCFSDHSRTYQKFGFKPYPGSSTFMFDIMGRKKEGIILHCRSSYLASETKKSFTQMQWDFLLRKSILF
jgi:hypothetical protein